MPTIGLAIIAKDEEKKLPNLLKSIEGAFDRVILVDTGSVDRTRQVFRDWCVEEIKRNKNFSCEAKYFHWIKDFAAARTFAQSLLDTDWEVWADCDDVVTGAQNIRGIVEQAQDGVMAFVCGYNYAQHPQTGQCVCYLRRERIVRRGHGKWVNRVHEAQTIDGPVVRVTPNVCEWVHQKQYASVEEMQKFDARRNLDILDNWVTDEPENTRVLAYLGTENAALGEIDLAIPFFDKYLGLNPEWDEERAQVCRKLAMCYMLKDQTDAAIELAFQAMRLLPNWPDSYNTLAEAYFTKGEFDKSAVWARRALDIGEPDTMLIINPLDYTYQPRKVLAGNFAQQKNWDEAIKWGHEAWEMNPLDEGLGQAVQYWRSMAKREHAANSIAMVAQTLVAHDEQYKALYLLEHCVPWFANEHQGVVNLRSELRERLEWTNNPDWLLTHYAEGGSKPEDFLNDEMRDKVAGSLPRTAFLYGGIHEQMIEMHREGLIDKAIDEQFPALLAAVGSGNPA